MAAILVPAGIYFGGVCGGLTTQSAMFTAILGMVVVLWIFAIVDEFIPPILAIVATLFIGLAPASVVAFTTYRQRTPTGASVSWHLVSVVVMQGEPSRNT